MAMKHWGGKPAPEENNGIPIEMPANCRQPATMEEMIAKYVHTHMASEALAEQKPETWEEADDFSEEDPDTLDLSRYELQELQEEFDAGYNPDRKADFSPETPQEAPQEEIATKDGPTHQSQEETPSGASE